MEYLFLSLLHIGDIAGALEHGFSIRTCRASGNKLPCSMLDQNDFHFKLSLL